MFKRWICLLMLLALAFTLCSCGNDKKTENAQTEKTETKTTETKITEAKTTNLTVKFLLWTNPSATDKQLFANFERLDYTVCGWEDCWQRLTNGVATGDCADVTMLFGAYFPSFVIKNLFMPIDEYWDKNDPIWNAEQMEEYTWNGKHYAFCSNESASTTFQSIMPVYMYYNKAMLENAGLEDPVKMEQDGRWNWDTFQEMCRQLTVDTNNDGKIDQYALGKDGYSYLMFVMANDTSYNKVSADGSVSLNFDDPALAEALQYMSDMYKFRGEMAEFVKGTAAFRMQGEDGMRVFNGVTDFEWDFANIPYGPNNTQHRSSGVWLSGLGVVNGSKNPTGAVAFIKYILDYKNAVTTTEYTPEQTERIKKSKENCRLQDDRYDYQDGFVLLSEVTDGETPAAVLRKYRERWASGILRTLEGTGIVTLAEGKQYQGMRKIDFESGDLGVMKELTAETVTITADPAEVVSQQYSLIIKGLDGKIMDFVEVDPEKVNKIEPGNIYNVSISYRVLEPFGNGGMGYLRFSFVDDTGTTLGEWGEISGSVGDKGTETQEIQFIDNIENVRLRISGNSVGKIAIDDIVITAHK